MAKKDSRKAAFGDFQTPYNLALEVCSRIFHYEPTPACIVEPTCGKGNFLAASLATFRSCSLYGFEINEGYLFEAQKNLVQANHHFCSVFFKQADFFDVDWESFFQSIQGSIVVIGNPPWVTNSELGQLNSSNLPQKSNFQQLTGVDAITGKSNFDISEWISVRLLNALSSRKATFAFLLKTTVARKILEYAWLHDLPIHNTSIFNIDAKSHFDAAVDACLFVCQTGTTGEKTCPVYKDICSNESVRTIGYSNGRLVANVSASKIVAQLRANTTEEDWRSGIKHDCAPVLELVRTNSTLFNQLGGAVEIEEQHLFPLFKSSDVAHQKQQQERLLIVTQKKPNEDTNLLIQSAPKAWAYLMQHSSFFEKRKSSIYQGKSSFSIFGVGEYTFFPWKVAISGLYKSLHFSVIPPINGKPVVFDDTVYFIPCHSEEEAALKARLLNSEIARDFFSAFVFWDAKRPITAQILKQLSLRKVAEELGCLRDFDGITSKTNPEQKQSSFHF